MHTPIPHGLLVAIEGIDGAGKTTQAAILAERCRERNLDYIISKEPTNGIHGRMLRESGLSGRLSLDEELELFQMDRAEHVEQLISPSLAAGKVVILDRYYFSNAAYQGARGADVNEVLRRNEAMAPEPDLLIFMDVPCDLGLDRVRARGDRPNHFERQDMLCRAKEIFEAIRRSYKVTIDATMLLEQVSSVILRHFTAAAVNKVGRYDFSPTGVNRILEIMGHDSVPWTVEEAIGR